MHDHKTTETVDHTKSCKNCGADFAITDVDMDFYKEIDMVEPTFCPECRQKRRLTWRNERSLYYRKCDATGKQILSNYAPDKPHKVYDNDYWYSDKWNPLDYGRDFDFNRPFFEQYNELILAVPQLSRSVLNLQNCDFVNECGWSKNCYLIFEADHNENCLYSNNIFNSKTSLDCFHAMKCEMCYECVNCVGCFNLKYSQNCQNCHDSWFLKNCIGCTNCYGCVNMRNKQHCYLNQKMTKEEYEAKIQSLNIKTAKQLNDAREKFNKYTETFPHKYMEGAQNEDSDGNFLWNTQRCHQCFDLHYGQDCKYVFDSQHAKKVWDMTVFGETKGVEYCYDNHEIGSSLRNIFFCDQVWENCNDLYYCKLCMKNAHDLFGCVGVKHKEFCILNKKYSSEEYASLKKRIIEHMKKTGEWGEFPPSKYSPFAYNESVAQLHYPLDKEEALKKGFTWRDPDLKEYKPQTYITPELIENTPDTIINEILACEDCGKNYKIVEEELKFYKRQSLPIPLKCHDCRHLYRFALRPPRILNPRTCYSCYAEIKTVYAKNRPEPVYCENCYHEAMD
ncbi:MAG: zinc-ribbon domain containing protein [Candidatus Peregrinibacteria bacterium]